MGAFVSVPKEALAELLRSSGSTLTPEEFLASLPETGDMRKYASRARAAAVSKGVLLVVTILAVLCVPFNLDSLSAIVENVIIVAGLATVTFFENRTHRFFREGNPAAPDLGFRNESYFAAAILVYGLYHAVLPSEVTGEVRDLVDPAMIPWIQGVVRITYVTVGVVGGLSQFGLAWYYRSAKAGA
jgi:hypothetical protein